MSIELQLVTQAGATVQPAISTQPAELGGGILLAPQWIEYTATAELQLVTAPTAQVDLELQGSTELVSGEVVPTPEYDLIDGGTPGQVYAGVLGFNLITGGCP